MGRYSERWRFKNEEAMYARRHVLEHEQDVRLNSGESSGLERRVEGASASFEGVPWEAVDRKWKVVGRHRWWRQEGMPVLEARATFYAVRHLLRKVENHGKRFLVLTDSLTAALAFGKGRAHSARLRGVVRRAAALLLAVGSSLTLRWLPSEWNPADGPSRGATEASSPKPLADGALLPSPSESDMARTRQPESEEERQDTGRKSAVGSTANSSNYLGHRAERPTQAKAERQKSKKKAYPTKGQTGGFPAQSLISETGDLGEIPDTLRRLPELVQTEHKEDKQLSTVGPSPVRVPPGLVLRGGRPGDGQLHSGSFSLLQTSDEGSQQATFESPVNAGVEITLSCTKSDAFAFRGGGAHGNLGAQDGYDRACPGAPSELFPLPASKRVRKNSSVRHSEACEKGRKGIPMVGSSAEPHRGRCPIEDSAMGSSHQLGPGVPTVPGTSSSAIPQASPEKQTGHGFQSDSLSGWPIPYGQLGKEWNESTGEPTPIPPPAWRRLSRSSQPSAGADCHSVERPVDEHKEREELRERQPSQPAVRSSRAASSTKMHTGRKRIKQVVPQPALAPQVGLFTAVFLEIFSGSGRLARTVGKVCGFTVLLWDVTLGAEYDLTLKNNQNKILEWMRGGALLGGHLGTPCNSFSRARDQPGGPPPLRSDSQPLGLPGLRPHDACKVRTGNILLRFSVAVMMLALEFSLPFTLENPQRSRLWICPPMSALLRRKTVQQVTSHSGILHVRDGVAEVHALYWSVHLLFASLWFQMPGSQAWLLPPDRSTPPSFSRTNFTRWMAHQSCWTISKQVVYSSCTMFLQCRNRVGCQELCSTPGPPLKRQYQVASKSGWLASLGKKYIYSCKIGGASRHGKTMQASAPWTNLALEKDGASHE